MQKIFQDLFDSLGAMSDKTLLILIVLLLTYVAAKIIKLIIKRAMQKSSKLMKVDHTQFQFFRHFVTALIYMIGIGIAIYMIPTLRQLSISLFAGAGVLAVIIGFASQQAVSNIISGFFIVIFKPFKVEDRIRVGTDVHGVVEDITLRHTVIRTFENKRVVIPNSVIGNEKIENENMSDPKTCRYVEFGISYDSDVDKAMKIMQEEAMKHPNYIDNRSEEDKKNKESPVRVGVIGFGDSSVNLRAWVWSSTPREAYRLGLDLNQSIKKRFDKEGIEIPFPYRTLVYKKDLK